MSSNILLRGGLGSNSAALVKFGYFATGSDEPLGAGVFVTDTIYRDALANITISNTSNVMALVWEHSTGNSWEEDLDENSPLVITGLSSVAGVITVEHASLPDVGEVVHIMLIIPDTLQNIFLPSQILVAP